MVTHKISKPAAVETVSKGETVSKTVAAVQKKCQEILEAAMSSNSSVVFAALSTVDGNSFAHASNRQEVVASRIAAMSSSLLALSESLSKESLDGMCSYNAISTNYGSIVTVRVPTPRRLHALSLCTDTSENMAMAMRLSFDTAEKLAKVFGHP